MARRGAPKSQVGWYLREWMNTVPLFTGRGGQTRFRELTGWSKAVMSNLYNNQQDYSPLLLEQAAQALNVEPFELLIPPDRAMALRGFRQTAAKIVESEPAPLPTVETARQPKTGTRS
jgi:hypothetical protein